MSRFTGQQQEGAMRKLRDRRRLEAETRNALTPKRRRRATRRKAERDCE